MRTFELGIVCLGLLMAAEVSAIAQTQETISTLEYQVQQSPDDLSCAYIPRRGGYVDYDYAVATLDTSADRRTVFNHRNAAFSTRALGNGNLDPAALCDIINEIKQQAEEGGILTVTKTVVLDVLAYPSYSPTGCSRSLQETISIQLATGVTLQGWQTQVLSNTLRDCRQ